MRERILTMFCALLVVASVSASAQQTGSGGPPTTGSPAQKSAGERAWDDLRWLMTALEAYSTDNDGLYGPVNGPREGAVADLDDQMKWYYAHSYPARTAPPHQDPWGRPYRFVLSKSRKLYALYSLGADGKLSDAPRTFIERLKRDQVTEQDLAQPSASPNIVVSGGVVFATADVVRKVTEPK